MNSHLKGSGILLAALTAFFLLPQTASAYLDPGTGSYMLQMLIATGLGLLFSVKIFWKKIHAFFRGIVGKKEKA